MSLRRAAPILVFALPLMAAEALRAAGLIGAEALDAVFAGAGAWAAYTLAGRSGRAALAAVLLLAGLIGLKLWLPWLRYAPYLLVLPAMLTVAAVFARGLMPGRESVLMGLIAVMGQRPADDPRFRRFIAGQCLLWALATLASAGLAVGAMVWEGGRQMLAQALGALVVAQFLWFVASHYYAGWRYGRPETWRDTLRAMAKVGLWPKPRT